MDRHDLPPGFRFHPTDEELIIYYLHRKLSDFGFSPHAIADVNLNKCEPWDLPDKAKMGEKEWYFFNLQDRKYPTGLRTNRATDSGYWKTTGKDKEIFHHGDQVGLKKTLVFYRGRAPKGEKTNWVMHEYRHQPKTAYKSMKEEWIVCRVFKKSPICKKEQPTDSSQATPTILDLTANSNLVYDLGDADLSALKNILTTPTSLNSASSSNTQINTFDHIDMNNNNITGDCTKMDINMYMNWVLNSKNASSLQQLMLPWTTESLMGLNSYQQSDAINTIRTSSNSVDPKQKQPLMNGFVWRNY